MAFSDQFLSKVRYDSLCPPVIAWRNALIQRRHLCDSQFVAPQKQARLLANSSAGATFGRSLPLWTFSDHFGDSQETDAFSPNRHGDNGIYHSRCTFELTPLSLSETRKGLTVQEEQEKRTGEQR